MNLRISGTALTVVCALTLVACNSNNDSRPSVSFAAPIAQTPANGVIYNFNQQPIRLQIVNSVKTGAKPTTYGVEVSSSSTFASTAFTRDGIAEGGDGTTFVDLPSLAGNTTYYWRWKATVDNVAGETSNVQSFFLRPNVTIAAPVTREPAANSTLFTGRPTFITSNAVVTGPNGTIFYEFQVSTSAAFGSLVATATVQQQTTTTSWTPNADLAVGNFFWRVRAKDPSNGIDGPFSAGVAFERKFGVDLAQVNYGRFPNISNWPQTGRLTAAFKAGDVVCTEFDTTVHWPNAAFLGDPSVQVVGNQWVFILINGVWHGGAGHWLRPGQYCKNEYDERFFVDAFPSPIGDIVLHGGEVFGVAVSTPARFYPNDKTLDHRTDVQMIVW
jgi:hypothetical protein